MKQLVFALFLLSTLLVTSFQTDNVKIEHIDTTVIKDVPSASGIIKSDNNLYLIGDNSPFLFKLDENYNTVSKTTIYSTELLKNETIKKAEKPDFEALELVGINELIIFGSGSKSPQRDIFITVTLGEKPIVNNYNISDFYLKLKQLPILENQELNIEGVAHYNQHIYLFNRGRNVVFSWLYNDLMAYFRGNLSFPQPTTTLFSLPKINGMESGFSGATTFKDKPYIIFTSSVENTDNAYDDGEILGSFVGMFSIENNVVSTNYRSVAIPNINEALKVESVAIEKEITDNESILLFTTDNDGRHSSIVKCKLKY